MSLSRTPNPASPAADQIPASGQAEAGAPGLLRRTVRGGLAGTAGLIVIWFGVSQLGLVSASALPPPTAVFTAMVEDASDATVWGQVGTTVTAWFIGLLVGVAAGASAGLLLAQSSWLYAFFRPYLMFLNATPRVVLAPFFILLLGIGMASRVALSVSLVLFVMLFAIHGAVQAVEPDLLKSVAIMGASRTEVWRHVVLPFVMPFFFSAMRICMSLALLGVVVGEILVSPSGIGWLLRLRGQTFDVAGVFSMLMVLGVLAGLGSKVIDLVSTRVLRWR